MITVPDYHFVGDGNGGWIKVPGSIKMRMSLRDCDAGEIASEAIVRQITKINGQSKIHLKERLSAFIHAYTELETYLTTPQGNISIQADGNMIRNMWHTYLIRGRELIDFLGTVIHIQYNLKDKVHGINNQKIQSLKNRCSQLSGKIQGLDNLLACITKYEELLMAFIELRNKDKEQNNTLKEPPYINPDKTATEGVLSKKNGEEIEFIAYFRCSYLMIINFGCDLLEVETPDIALSPPI
jgi:hypothetical protein